MSIHILAVGKKHDSTVINGIQEFNKRLRKPFDVEWHLLSNNPVKDKAAAEESERLLTHCRPDDFVILLDESGQMLTSPQLSQRLQEQFNWSTRVVIIIGGAFGVNQSVKDRADLIWSLSHLVFPHQLVRLILIEQIYRAQTIASGEAYHHQ